MTALARPIVPEARQRSTAGRRRRWPFSPWHLVLIPATILLLFPFVWLVVTSLETNSEALHFPPILTPHVLRFANYPDALNAAPFGHLFLNSTVVAVTTRMMRNRK